MPTSDDAESRGLRRLATGAGLGLAAGIIALIIPIVFLWLSTETPGGYFRYGRSLIQATAIFLLAGSILFVLSLLLYRRAFGAFRAVDPRFRLASALCLIGTLGFLLLIVTAAVLLAGSDALVACLSGRPSQLLGCVRSGSPLGASTGLVGFVLGWVGGAGIVAGVATAGRRFRQGTLLGGSVLYFLLLLVLIAPLAFLLAPFPGAPYLFFAIPVLSALAPGLVLGGAQRATAARRRAAPAA